MEEIHGGELFNYISSKGCLPESEAVYLFRQIIHGLKYCHRLRISHRDLKPENILLDKKTLTIKLIDFGMAAFQPVGEPLYTPCGSPHYAAPELLRGHPYDGSLADCWSAAVVFWVMLIGEPPFNYADETPENRRLAQLYSRIMALDIIIPTTISIEAQDFFRKVFVTNPEKRLNTTQIWEHPLLHKYDHAWGYEGIGIEHWIGPSPKLEEWEPLTSQTIDPDIFRRILVLWHDANEDAVVERLCCQE